MHFFKHFEMERQGLQEDLYAFEVAVIELKAIKSSLRISIHLSQSEDVSSFCTRSSRLFEKISV